MESGENWSVLGESVPGTSHAARDTPCQDAFRFACVADVLCIAVADGAGSATHSQIGATLACDELLARLISADPVALSERGTMVALLAEVRDAIFAEADRIGVAARELACTALVAVVTADRAVFAQVGDGAIVYRDGGDYETAFWPEPGEYANATDFLTDDRFAERVEFRVVEGSIAEVAVFSDGLQRVALDFAKRTPHADFFRPLFAAVRAAADIESLSEPFRGFLDSPRINERTDDDKTLVIATRSP